MILGGARSGKSALAERVAAECGEPVAYVATGLALDAEMADRITHHRTRRPPTWRTIESPHSLSLDYGDARTIIVEDLTFLLSNHMARDLAHAESLTVKALEGVLTVGAHVIVVSNEVGMGLVPPYPLGRAFRDALGRVNQVAAAACSEVYLVVAGLPLRLK